MASFDTTCRAVSGRSRARRAPHAWAAAAFATVAACATVHGPGGDVASPASASEAEPASASDASRAPASRSTEPSAPAGGQVGKATYYSDKLAGRKTASGEPYDPTLLTAAHRTLPFGTWVLVTTGKGKSVRVKINDRGPFGKSDRIIDLSKRAAREIDLLQAGVMTVTVRPVDGP